MKRKIYILVLGAIIAQLSLARMIGQQGTPHMFTGKASSKASQLNQNCPDCIRASSSQMPLPVPALGTQNMINLSNIIGKNLYTLPNLGFAPSAFATRGAAAFMGSQSSVFQTGFGMSRVAPQFQMSVLGYPAAVQQPLSVSPAPMVMTTPFGSWGLGGSAGGTAPTWTYDCF